MKNTQKSNHFKSPNQLARIGALSLTPKTQNLRKRPLKLQQINDDDQYMQLTNIETKYVDENGNIVDINSLSKTVNTNVMNPDTMRQKQAYETSRTNQPRQEKRMFSVDKMQSKNRFGSSNYSGSSDEQYNTLIKSIRTNKQSFPKKKINFFNNQSGENELQQVEDIINEIQDVMGGSLSNYMNNYKKDFKNTPANRKDKKNWQSKPISSKFQSKLGNFDKLDQLLYTYKIPQQKNQQQQTQQQKQEINFSVRATKNRQRLKRTKQYNDVSKSLMPETHEDSKKDQFMNNDDKIEKISEEQSNEQKQKENYTEQKQEKSQQRQELSEQKRQQKQNLASQISVNESSKNLQLQNIEIIQINWLKLPIILTEVNPENKSNFTKLQQYPQQQQYIEIFSQYLPNETSYNCYSIFNTKVIAGITKSKTLTSEEEFRDTWMGQCPYQLEDNEKDMLCQFDFQWFRAIIQNCFNHSIEEILVKNIEYSIERYQEFIKNIHGNTKNQKALSEVINHNKLKMIDAHLEKIASEKQTKSKRKSLALGVIPNLPILELSSKDKNFQFIKNHIQEFFIGGIYSFKNDEENFMAVIVNQDQAANIDLEKKQKTNIINLGPDIFLYINSQEKSKQKDTISINRQKGSSTNLKIRITEKRNPNDIKIIEVFQELFYGSKFSIILN